MFIGYAEGSKAYRILDPKTQRVRTARNVVFNEGRGWAWDKAVDDGSAPTYDDFTVEYVHFEGAGGVGGSSLTSGSTPVPEPPPTPAPATPTAPRSPARTSATMSSSPASPQPATPRTPAPTGTTPGTSTPPPARVEHGPVELATPLSRRGTRRRVPRRRAVAVPYDGEPSRRPAGAGTGASRPGGAVAPCV